MNVSDLDVHQRAMATLRQSARRELDAIAEVAGRDSALLSRCREAWRLREAGASASLLCGDVANAVTILDRGVHALHHALEASRRERIPVDELFALMVAC
jgi:hypothetical protein